MLFTSFTSRLYGAVLLTALAVPCARGESPRFYPDDPLWKEPAPFSVKEVDEEKLYALVDFYKNSIYRKGERHTPGKVYPSTGVNTLGEVPDSTWFQNRHDSRHRLTLEQLVRGPNKGGPPVKNGRWKVVDAKAEGVTPGFTIEDSKGRRFLLKFDPRGNSELATGAEVVITKFLHAIGYYVPENYILYFRRDELETPGHIEFEDMWGNLRVLRPRDVDEMLKLLTPSKNGAYRALASLYLPGKPVGGFKYYKRRDDDPNEISNHEHLRVLRGLQTVAAWLNHTDSKALNSLDMVVEENGRKFIRHYLIDFGSSLGSDSLFPKDPRNGHRFMLDWKPGLRQLTTFGAKVPDYARVNYPDHPAVGNFAVEAFDPDTWKPNYPNAAFANRLPGDQYWAAKKVMAFTDEDIRAIVSTGQYRDPRAERIIGDTLIARRDKIGQTILAKVLPLENFRVQDGALRFDNLAEMHGFPADTEYSLKWFQFDNNRNQSTALKDRVGANLPPELRAAPRNSYWAVNIQGRSSGKSLIAFLRRAAGGWEVVGVDRQGAADWAPR